MNTRKDRLFPPSTVRNLNDSGFDALNKGILDRLPHGLAILDENGRIVYLNPVFSQLMDESSTSMCNKRFPQLKHDWYLPSGVRLNGGSHPVDQAFADGNGLKDMFLGFDREVNDPTRRIWLRINLVPAGESEGMFSGAILTVTDATGDVQRKEQNEFQTMLLDQIQDRIVATDLEGNITYTNPANFRVLGKGQEDVRGKHVSILNPTPEGIAKQDEIISTALRKGFWKGEVVDIAETGERFFFDTHVWVMRNREGRPTGLVGISNNITDRVRAEEALRLSEWRHRMVSELISDYVYFARIKPGKGVDFEWVTGAFEPITGYTLEEIRASGKGWDSIIYHDDRVTFAPRIKSVLSGNEPVGEPLSAEYRIVTKQGRIRWLRDMGILKKPEDAGYAASCENELLFIGASVDITERKLSEISLRANEQRARLYFNQNFIGMGIFTDRGWLEINDRFCQITGFKKEDLVRQDWRGLTLPEDWEAESPLFRKLENGGLDNYQIEKRMIRPDGGLIWTQCAVRRIQLAGMLQDLIMVMVMDTTRLVEAREEIEAQRKKLMQADRMVSLGMLVSGVAHEVNNPNNAIRLDAVVLKDIVDDLVPLIERYSRENAGFMAGNLDSEELLEDLPQIPRRILEHVNMIQKITKELKGYARRNEEPVFSNVDLNEIVKISVRLLGDLIRRSTRDFQMRLAPELPLVKGDFQRLEQVVVNLLQNACYALTEKTQPIVIRTGCARRDGTNSVVLEISDGGRGMSPEVLARIGEPFFTTRGDQGGTGLGLPISRKLIEEHGGRLEFVSTDGKGTLVKIILPADTGKNTEDMDTVL